MGARNGTTDLWETWRLAQARSELALNTWYAAPRSEKARAYATYTAALELNTSIYRLPTAAQSRKKRLGSRRAGSVKTHPLAPGRGALP